MDGYDEEQIGRITGYVVKLNTSISTENNDLFSLVVNTVLDRVLLYLNTDELEQKLERVVAQIVVGVYNQTNNNKASTGPEQAIRTVSDNGQSVSYANEVKNYLNTADDQEIFGGFHALLSRYRRVDVGA